MVTPKHPSILSGSSTGSASQSVRKRKSVVFVDVNDESSSDSTAFTAQVHYIYIGVISI